MHMYADMRMCVDMRMYVDMHTMSMCMHMHMHLARFVRSCGGGVGGARVSPTLL